MASGAQRHCAIGGRSIYRSACQAFQGNRNRSSRHKVKNRAALAWRARLGVAPDSAIYCSHFASRSRYAFLNFETFGAITIWQYG